MKILLVQPKSTGYMGRISKSGKAGFARVTLTTIAALTPPEHEVVIHPSGSHKAMTPLPKTRPGAILVFGNSSFFLPHVSR